VVGRHSYNEYPSEFLQNLIVYQNLPYSPQASHIVYLFSKFFLRPSFYLFTIVRVLYYATIENLYDSYTKRVITIVCVYCYYSVDCCYYCLLYYSVLWYVKSYYWVYYHYSLYYYSMQWISCFLFGMLLLSCFFMDKLLIHCFLYI
jgi:hypothetical protein